MLIVLVFINVMIKFFFLNVIGFFYVFCYKIISLNEYKYWIFCLKRDVFI